MSEKIYKKIRVVGCSPVSYEKAIEFAVKKVGETVEEMSWFEVVEFRGAIVEGKPVEWQATVDVSFKVK